ncbi:hypothetical protein [Ruania alba]|uniref:Asp23/Gls24 family envelope stress response protein n=1 Tax=Ruania alba TaxID=648782 RepID=A0A1H5LUD3_9MICO|nr:hypothetical protein [Ruania alba]SEE80652.1 hypothetical protein SAMN04488554_2986 [Ruania alba]
MEMRPEELEPPSDLLARAAGELRQLTDDGWVRAERGVLDRVARALRAAPQVRGRHDGGTFLLAGTVLSARVAAEVDRVPGARAFSVHVSTDDGDWLDGVTVALSVAYGTQISAVSAEARRVAAATATAALGVRVTTDQVVVDVVVEDVHLEDGPAE